MPIRKKRSSTQSPSSTAKPVALSANLARYLSSATKENKQRVLAVLKREIKWVTGSTLDQVRDRIAKADYSKSQCSKGCSACCYVKVDASKEERERLKKYPAIRSKDKPGCPFLGPDEACTVYKDRPLMCRVHNVISDPKLCSTPKSDIQRLTNLQAEILVSAWLTVDGDVEELKDIEWQLKQD